MNFTLYRVGYNGQNDLKVFHGNLDAAKKNFEKKFADKTKNNWENRSQFVKVAGKYDLVDIQIGEGAEAEDEVDEPAKKKKKKQEIKVLDSQLDVKVQKLIDLICDSKVMEATLKHLNFDLNKTPLGKVTEDQIKAGYEALSKIANIINDTGKSEKKRKELMEACNQFYTRIPHYFGMKVPPMISSIDEVKNKIQLLEALNDITLGIKAIKEEEIKEEPEDEIIEVPNPLDAQYKKLDVKLEPLDHGSEDFSLLEQYIQSTHGKTHSQYTLEVEDIFICQKESLGFKDKGNRMLLFHGSRLSNYAGILSQGLRIAPPEAPVTGYMFGKGCYFADCASKSANYW